MGDISYAFRSLRKSPLASLTIIVTVALGLGMVAAVFTFLNMFHFRVDNVPNIHELFGVERPRTADGDLVRLTKPVYDSLRRETAVFTDVFAMVPETDSRVNGRTMSGSLVTGNFFQVLGVGAAQGRVLTAADDDRRQPVVVLSDRGWATHFANDPAVLSRSLPIHGVRYDIVGVMPKGFRGLMVGAPDYWAPLSLIEQLQPTLTAEKKEVDVDIIGRLRPGMSREVALAQLVAWDSRRIDGGAERRTAGITLVPRRGTVPQPMESVLIFTPLFASFGLILLIGCANVASLLLARAVSRQKEVGVRLSLGASRGQIVRQLLTESVMLALIAAALGYAISRLILETTIWAVLSTMPPDIGDVRLLVPDGDWRVGVFLAAAAIVASVMFGLAPALQATRIELVRTMRGEITRDARPGRVRNVLIGVQVTASALLLISCGIFLRSALASSTAHPGMRTSDTAIVPVVNERLRQQVVDAVTRDPLVAAVAAAFPDPVFGSRSALGESAQAKSPVAYKFVSPEFFSVLGIDLVRGRTFTAAESSADAGVAIVAESFARKMWPDGDALGQQLRLERDPAEHTTREQGSAAYGQVHDCRRRARRGRICVRRRQTNERVRANYVRSRRDDVGGAGARRSRARSQRAVGAPHRGRSEYRTNRDVADDGRDGDLLPADRVLVDVGAGWFGIDTDAVGRVQRDVVSGRAAHEGNRRAHGPRRDGTRCGEARGRSNGRARGDRSDRGCGAGARHGHCVAHKPGAHWVGRAAARSRRVCGRPGDHRPRLRPRGVGAHDEGRAHRPDEELAARLTAGLRQHRCTVCDFGYTDEICSSFLILSSPSSSRHPPICRPTCGRP